MMIVKVLFIVVLILCFDLSVQRERRKAARIKPQQETSHLKNTIPIKYENEYYMFWRPQKVGSSTLLSIFVSMGFRYSNIPRPNIGNFVVLYSHTHN